jgi:hypothetical protein
VTAGQLHWRARSHSPRPELPARLTWTRPSKPAQWPGKANLFGSRHPTRPLLPRRRA